jgi:hypothetical protein
LRELDEGGKKNERKEVKKDKTNIDKIKPRRKTKQIT